MSNENRNASHGHVTPRPDGAKARCGGPPMCKECCREQAALAATPQQPAQAELLQALVAATDLLHGTVKSSDRPSDYIMRAVAGFRALIAKAAAIQAPEAAPAQAQPAGPSFAWTDPSGRQPAQAPVLSEECKPMDDDVLVDIGRCFSTSNDYEGGNCVRLHFNRDELIAFARALLSTNPKSEPAAPSQALAHAAPAIDYTALIHACFERHKYRQGTNTCVAFKNGAEWFREQVVAQATAAAHEPARQSSSTLASDVAQHDREQVAAWMAVVDLLYEVFPEWASLAKTGQDAALLAIRKLTKQPAASDRDARDAERYRFLRDDPEVAEEVCVAAFGQPDEDAIHWPETLDGWCDAAIRHAAMSAAAKEAKS